MLKPTMLRYPFLRLATLAVALGCASSVLAQAPPRPAPREASPRLEGVAPPPQGATEFEGPPPFEPGGFGPGGPGPGPMREELKLVKQFDKNSDGWLNAEERKAAREFLKQQGGDRRPGGRRGRFGPPGGFGGRGGDSSPPEPGRQLSPQDVQTFANEPLYASNVVRTLFLQFDETDWEKELAEFKNTDVEVPAKLTVDGRSYSGVGVHFHGMSSFMMVPEGRKRSLVLTLDLVHPHQHLGGYRKLNLLNAHEDPSFLRTVLSLEIARQYLPAPKANFARVAINGECWGIYVNQEHFSKDFVAEWFGTTKGARWKVPGSPNGRGGLDYIGEDVEAYQRRYEIKSKDDPKSWANLIQLCRVLNETAPERLESALGPWLDIDGALKFLAWDNVLANGDGYWTRASDYDLYLDDKGRFHVIPYDANETFSSGGGPGGSRGFAGPGGRRGPGGPGPGGGVRLDPLVTVNDATKPLASKLLAEPALRARYLRYVRDIAERWLDWNNLGPIAAQYHALIADEVKADTRKLDSFEAFESSLAGESQPVASGGPRPAGSLKRFAERRRAYLLDHAEVKQAGEP